MTKLIDNKWLVSFESSFIWLTHPDRYRPKELWDKWARMQARILDKIKNKLPGTHVYIRYNTRFPKQYSDIIQSYQVDTQVKTRWGAKVLLFPDCQDQNIWERVLLGDSFLHGAKSFYLLNDQPANWRDIISELYEIIQKLDDLNSLRNYQSQLSSCRCLCSVEDSDLLIVTIDLSEHEMLSILEDEAHIEGLDLVIEKNN